MGRLNRKVLGYCWAWFTVLTLLVNYVTNGFVNGFAVVVSVLGALPVALLIAWCARDRPGS